MGRGATLTIRGPREDDANQLGELISLATRFAPSALYETDELGDDTELLGADVISSAKHDGSLLLVGEVGLQLVGMARAIPREFIRCAHVATLGILVAPGWRRRSVGVALLEEVTRRVFLRPVIERLEIQVAADDTGLTALVTRCGFKAVRVERRGLVRDGIPKDLSLFVRDR